MKNAIALALAVSSLLVYSLSSARGINSLRNHVFEVEIVNAQTAPLPVIASPQPMSRVKHVFRSPLDAQDVDATVSDVDYDYMVPGGKRLVVEYLSCLCLPVNAYQAVSCGLIGYDINGNSSSHPEYIAPFYNMGSSAGFGYTGQAMKTFFGPEEIVRAYARWGERVDPECYWTLVGYLEDAPAP